MSRFQFVADHRHAFEVKRLCTTVEVARSAYYAWDKAAPGRAQRAAADAALAARIKAVQDPGGSRHSARQAAASLLPEVAAAAACGRPAETAHGLNGSAASR